MDKASGAAVQGWGSGTSAMTPAALVIAESEMGDGPKHAVMAAGGQVRGRVRWREAAERLDRQGPLAVVLAEARGAADADIAPVLPMLDAIGRRGDARIVVTLDFEQIDLLTATLAGPGVELLCAPSDIERIAALCIAGMRSNDRVHDVGRSAEAVRLQRLNAEVARIAETLARLTRGDGDLRYADRRGGAVGEPTHSYRAPPPAADAPEVTARDIRETIRARRLRDQYFGNGLFEDPAWDMLLDLFAAELERAQVSVSSLCIAAAVAPTTALRWIARMTEAGLFERQPDPFDRRRAFLGLSDRASPGMRNYIAAVGRGGVVMV
ncbi:hypothetical protein [Sphingomonas sp. HMP6]|uniref:hypothetical protein n=1 Tax=Sphingomonas sp. HMP6 TaxID=1517551 RepID=UPI001596FEA4|nr:hypothetical protein [Sphingomonas sp. HMP6]